MSNQAFSEEEIARIIKKAAQLESEQQGSDDAKPGLTLEELVTAASDSCRIYVASVHLSAYWTLQ